MLYQAEKIRNLIHFNFNFSYQRKYIFSICQNANIETILDIKKKQEKVKRDKGDYRKRQKKDINATEKLKGLSNLVYSNIYLPFEYKQPKHSLGFILLEFLNHYEEINSCIEKYENKMLQVSDSLVLRSLESYRYFHSSVNILSDLSKELKKIKGIENCSEILLNEINSFNLQFQSQIDDYTDKLKQIIKETKQKIRADDLSDFGIWYCLQEYENQYKKFQTTEIYRYHHLDFIKQFKLYLKALYEMCITSFIPINKVVLTNKSTQIFNGKPLNLPPVKLYFEKRQTSISSIRTIRYEYEITSMQDVVSISLYHIVLCKKVLLQCKNCEDYFLPRMRNNEKYCDKYIRQDALGRNLYCGDIGKYENYKQNKSNTLQLYDKLEDRLKKKIKRGNPNQEDFERLLTELQNKRDKIFGKNNKKDRKNKRLKDFHKYLVQFDKEYQATYKSKKAYDSKRFWKFND